MSVCSVDSQVGAKVYEEHTASIFSTGSGYNLFYFSPLRFVFMD
jgi:hypothetical protein